MKKILLYQLLSCFILIGLLFPNIKWILDGNELPKKDPFPLQNDVIQEIVEFDGKKVTIFLSNYNNVSYREEGESIALGMPVCNADESMCLYADKDSLYDIYQNDIIIEPVEIRKLPTRNEELAIYHLETSKETKLVPKGVPQKMTTHCSLKQFCSVNTEVTYDDLEQHIATWTKLDSSRLPTRTYSKLTHFLSIRENWLIYDPIHGGNISYGMSLAYYDWDGKHVIYCSKTLETPTYYELTETQFTELLIELQ